MKTFSVQWEELHTVTIQALDENEAIERVVNGDYDNAGEDAEITMPPQATELHGYSETCSICNKHEDDDGRCGCTNKDAHGV